MRRRLLNLLTALSLLLFVAVVAVWLRSYRVGELLMHDAFKRDGPPYELTSTWFYLDSGGVGVIRTRAVCTASSPAEAREWFELYFRDHPAGWTRNRHDPWGYPKVASAARSVKPPPARAGGATAARVASSPPSASPTVRRVSLPTTASRGPAGRWSGCRPR